MAYGNYLGAVTEEDIASLRANASTVVEPRHLVGVSHLVAYWIRAEPLGPLLNEALDGGSRVNEQVWHLLRAPTLHDPEAARALAVRLEQAWYRQASELQGLEAGLAGDIERVLEVFRHAAQHGLYILSALDWPLDEDGASRVQFPFAGVERPGV